MCGSKPFALKHLAVFVFQTNPDGIQNEIHIFFKAHLNHLIRLINDHPGALIQHNIFTIQHIFHTARSANQHLHPYSHLKSLILLFAPSHNNLTTDIGRVKFLEFLIDLDR